MLIDGIHNPQSRLLPPLPALELLTSIESSITFNEPTYFTPTAIVVTTVPSSTSFLEIFFY
jgi:hypothetical protein